VTFQMKLALRYLNGRKLRTGLTLLAITFGVMILFGFNGILPAFHQAIQQKLSAATGEVDLTVTSEMRGGFDASVAGRVAGTASVALVAPSLTRPLVVPPAQALTTGDGRTITAFILRGVTPEQTGIERISLADGRFLQNSPDELLISNSLAQATGVGVGDTLTLPAATGSMNFTIVGITRARPPLGSEELIVSLAAAQSLFNLPGQINTIEARFVPGSDAATVQQAVLERLGSGYKLGGHEAGSELASVVESATYIYTIFGVIALALSGFIIFITFRTVIVERRRDIGMLRAIGASRKTILAMILTESLLLGVIGTAAGIVAGYLLAIGVLVGLGSVLQSYMQISTGGPVYAPGNFVLALTLGVGVSVIAGVMPAVTAMRVSPLEVLRPSLPEVEWRAAGRGAIVGAGLVLLSFLSLASGNNGLAAVGIVLFVSGLALIGPALIYPIARISGRLLSLAFAAEGCIAQGNLTRQPGRAAVTASAISIGLALLVGVGGMIASSVEGMSGWIDKTMGSDYLFVPQSMLLGGGNIGAGPQLVERIKAVPGVGAVTTLRQTTATIDGADLQLIGLDPVSYPEVAGLIFSTGDEATAYDDLGDGRTLIVNGIFAAQNGVQLGDTLLLPAPAGVQSYRVIAIAGDFLNYKLATGYISQANMAQDFNETADLLIMVNQTQNAEPVQVEMALRAIARDYPAFTFYLLAEWQQEMGQMLEAFSGMYVLLIVLAIPALIALINTMAINVLERTREIGTLRAVGATRRQVRRIIMAESLLLAATGVLFGLVAGLWFGYVLVGAMNQIGLVFPFAFSYAGLILALAVGLGFGIMGGLIPARQAARLDIVQALAYE
jgi:putative ABC transport system permease protein